MDNVTLLNLGLAIALTGLFVLMYIHDRKRIREQRALREVFEKRRLRGD